MVLKNFIVFEGLDGTGTTSQLHLLQKAFTSCGLHSTVHFTYEPTDSPIGTLIRSILSGSASYDKKTLAYLFAADRCEHVYGKKGIVEHVQNRKVVFSDRYLFSSLAYQSLETGHELVQLLNQPFPLPEYLFFFDLPVQTAMERIEKRNSPREIYEKIEIQQKVAEAYRRLFRSYAERFPDMRIIPIDAAQQKAEIHKNIWNIVCKLPIV